MHLIGRVVRRLQPLERLCPPAARVPLRFFVQQAIGALEPEIKLLERLVPRQGVGVDVGANYGTYTYALSRICNWTHAFEPIPQCAAALRAWARNRCVTVHEYALSDQDAAARLNIPCVGGNLITTRSSLRQRPGKGHSIEVRVSTLDALDLPRVDFIKVDVEGHELAVLRGAVATLERCMPTLLVEIDPLTLGQDQFATTFEWLTGQRYRPYYCMRGELRPCDATVADTHPDIYNFIFLPTHA